MITTASNPNAFPSSLKQKKRSLVQHKDVDKTQVYVDEECEKCGYEKLAVKTMQLRSADEGATTFYTCEKCGHQVRRTARPRVLARTDPGPQTRLNN